MANLWNKLGKQSDASGPSHREELRRLLRRTVELTGSCGARQLSNVAHGAAKCRLMELRVETSALLATVAEAAVPRLRDFTSQGLANTVWAFATAGHAAPELLDAIAAVMAQRLREFSHQELANTAWAFAVADHLAPAHFGSHDFVQLCAAQHGFATETLRELHQWQLWREERGAAWPPLPPELARRCHAAFCHPGGGRAVAAAARRGRLAS